VKSCYAELLGVSRLVKPLNGIYILLIIKGAINMKNNNEDQFKIANDNIAVPLPLSNAENTEILFSKLLIQIAQSLSKPSFQTWFTNISINSVDLIKNTIVFGTDSKFKKEWLETRYLKLLSATLQTITNIDFTISFTVSLVSSRNSVNPPLILSSAFDFLFEGENNDYDEEYKDFIDSDELIQKSKLLSEKVRETQIYTNELFDKYFSDKANKTTGTVEERLVKLEENTLQIQSKQLEQDTIIDHMTILTTRLEAKIASFEEHAVKPSHSQEVE